MTLDSPIVETGLDSLERMEILASLEERFGGRFPPEVLPELETTRHVIEAVEKYLGGEPRTRTAATDGGNPPGNLSHRTVPRIPCNFAASSTCWTRPGVGNPYLHRPPGDHQRPHDHRRPRVRSISPATTTWACPATRSSRKAAKDAIDRYGTSVSASRLASGEKEVHGELERAIARFLGTEAALSFVGGHATNETVIGHLVGPGDLVLHDALAHNSIVQGAILSGAGGGRSRTTTAEAAERLLAQFRREYRRVLMVDRGRLQHGRRHPRSAPVHRREEAAQGPADDRRGPFAWACWGATAAASASTSTSIRRDVDVWMGTMSKTLGSCGGYIAGCKELIEYLKYTAPGLRLQRRAAAGRRGGRRWPRSACWRPSRSGSPGCGRTPRLFLALARAARPEHRQQPGIRRSCR